MSQEDEPSTKPAGSRTGASSRRQSTAERDAEDLAEAQAQIVKNVSAGMTFWFASLKAYQAMVDHWVEAREKALVKSLEAVQEINEAPDDDKKLDRAADVIVEQLSTFQRDLLAVQMKTAAQMGALFSGIQKPDDIVRKFGEANASDFRGGTADSPDPRKGSGRKSRSEN